jgi:tetratricopeptide (TPR) repeat protein
MSIPYAAGSLYSTVEDLYRWDRALYADTLLPEKAKTVMFTPTLENYAYGWAVEAKPVGPEEADRTVVAHGGGINGFNTLILRVPEDRHLIVLLNNTGGTRLDEMSDGILSVLYGREPAAPKRSIGELLLQSVHRDGVDAAIVRYRELKADHEEEYDFGEGQLNQLGYQLLSSGDVVGALKIFRLNVEVYPEAFNPHDSLGEALAAAGETEEAIKSYARSLALNPGNRNAVIQLEKLTRSEP